MTNYDMVQKESNDFKYLCLRNRLIFTLLQSIKIMYRIKNQKFWDTLGAHVLEVIKREKDGGYL